MIYGHIDLVSRTHVGGWIFSAYRSLAGMPLLAYIDDAPVGRGEVGLFREDLVQAGIGDGHGGFAFPIELKPTHDPRLVNVRLDGSNALIRQEHACLVAREDVVVSPRAPRDGATLAWMRGRGWLTAAQHDVMDRLGRFGVVRQRLTMPVAQSDQDAWAPDGSAQHPLEDLAALAGEFLQLHMHLNVSARIHDEIWAEDLVALRSHLHTVFPAIPPVIGLWAPSTNCVNVSEGSHLGLRLLEPISGVDYEFGEDHLLWLNLDTNFHVPTGGFMSPAVAFVPARE
jgi:hypothetical protein